MLSSGSETAISAIRCLKDYAVDRMAAGFGDEYNGWYQSRSPVIGQAALARSAPPPPPPPSPRAHDQISLSLIIAVTVALGCPLV